MKRKKKKKKKSSLLSQREESDMSTATRTRYQRTIEKKDRTIANLKEQIEIRDKSSSREKLEATITQLKDELKKSKAK